MVMRVVRGGRNDERTSIVTSWIRRYMKGLSAGLSERLGFGRGVLEGKRTKTSDNYAKIAPLHRGWTGMTIDLMVCIPTSPKLGPGGNQRES